jgi:hypothetical protein
MPDSPASDAPVTAVGSATPTSGQLDTVSPARAEYISEQFSVLPAPQRFWNVAYSNLENDEDTAVLAKTYVEFLKKTLGSEEAPSPSVSDQISSEISNPIHREAYMRKLAAESSKKNMKALAIAKGTGDILQFILSVQDMIDAALQDGSQTALPWPGVCVGFQVSSYSFLLAWSLCRLIFVQILLNPAKTTYSNLRGIIHIGSRMKWYCALTEILTEENAMIGQGLSLADLMLEQSVVPLYEAILLFQMKSVYLYTRNRLANGLLKLQGLDDWEASLRHVLDAEYTVHKHLDQYASEHVRVSLERLAKHVDAIEIAPKDLQQDLRDFIAQQQKTQIDHQDMVILRDLFVSDPQDDMSRIEMSKDSLIDDVYDWVLYSEEYAAFTNWSQTENPPTPRRFLWVKGLPGTGKTMLLIGIIRQLLAQPVMLSPSVSYVFCQSTNFMLNNVTAVLRSLLWMLLMQQPHLISHLQSKYEYAGSSLFRDSNAVFALSDALADMLKDPELSRVYFIIDALDECEEGRDQLFRIILSSLQLTDKVKWLVSARPELNVLGRLKGLDRIPAVVELDAERLNRSIHAYVDHKLSVLRASYGYPNDLLTRISHILHTRAGDTFIWVSLIFRELENVDEWYALEVIESFPRGLSELYDSMMDKILREKAGVDLCKKVLSAVCLTYRPLTLDELAVVAGLPSAVKPRKIVERCGSFLTIGDGSVFLIHQSAKEYLLESRAQDLLSRGTAQEHVEIAERLMRAMSSALRRNIYSLQDFGTESKNLKPPNPNPLASLHYACRFWLDHLLDAAASGTPDLLESAHIFEFLRRHFLHWLETLSLSGRLSDASSLIAKLLYTGQVSLWHLQFCPHAKC